MSAALLLWLVPVLVAPPPPASAIAPADVVAFMAAVPARGRERPGGYGRGRDAAAIARGIAAAVNAETDYVLESAREDAALLAVFSSYESANRIANARRACISGDGGRSLGPLQLQGAGGRVACDPELAAREWLRRAREAMATCAASPREERLSMLASGSCGAGPGRAISRRRVELAVSIAAGTDT